MSAGRRQRVLSLASAALLVAMAAAALLGVGESLAGGYISTTAKDAVGFSLMIVVLLARPEGLFGRRVRV